jgi:hypothetical protein
MGLTVFLNCTHHFLGEVLIAIFWIFHHLFHSWFVFFSFSKDYISFFRVSSRDAVRFATRFSPDNGGCQTRWFYRFLLAITTFSFSLFQYGLMDLFFVAQLQDDPGDSISEI